MLSVSYDDLRGGKASLGAWATHPEGSWVVREDRVGKGGFIYEMGFNTSAEAASTHHDLVFTFHNLTKRAMVASNMTLLLSMLYLRTYENAGAVEVYFCDSLLRQHQPSSSQFLLRVDALWSEYLEYRYSLPSLYTNLLSYRMCEETSSAVKDDELLTVRVRHLMLTDAPSEVRKSQKFKITNIDVCLPVIE